MTNPRWGLKCTDCNVSTEIGNEQSPGSQNISLVVAQHAKAIGAMLPLAERLVAHVTLGFGHTIVLDIPWFAEHGAHKLVPADHGECNLHGLHDY